MQRIHAWFIKRMKELYGNYEYHQFFAYRCTECRQVITWAMINNKTPCGCESLKVEMRPTSLTFWEEIKLMLFPWLYR